MRITVKLFATLTRYAPPGIAAGTPFVVDIPEGSCVADLMAALGLPPAEVKVAYVNGRRREPDTPLHDHDTVGIFPPVGGG